MRNVLAKSLKSSVAIALVMVGASTAGAQQSDSVYSTSQLSQQPKLVSPAATASLVSRSYPAALRRANVGGSVQLQFVIDEKGKVEPSSVEVVAASVPSLGEAAKSIADKIEFHPGKVGNTPVRTAVLLPLTFRP